MVLDWQWAMPHGDTLMINGVSVDPFARNCRLATHTNDINPDTEAQHHLWAEDFITLMIEKGVSADFAFFDPPFSTRQAKEIYAGFGRQFTKEDAQNVVRWYRERKLLAQLMKAGGYVMSLGWNSSGMGKKLGFEKVEILLVNHAGGHNDTICVVERKL
jgi:hypothetical protein